MQYDIDKDIIGYCSYCKDEIHVGEEYVVNNGDILHIDCWKVTHKIIEELDFDE